MKGTIVRCVQELVTEKFGVAKWKEALRKAGLPETQVFLTTQEVPDEKVMAVVKAVAETNSLPLEAVLEAFGEHWCTAYAPSIYDVYFKKAKNVKEFLLNLDQIHTVMTKSMPGAHPPHFSYEWKDDRHLVMHYASKRGLVALMPGLVRGLAKYYHEKLNVNVVGDDVHIAFAA